MSGCKVYSNAGLTRGVWLLTLLLMSSLGCDSEPKNVVSTGGDSGTFGDIEIDAGNQVSYDAEPMVDAMRLLDGMPDGQQPPSLDDSRVVDHALLDGSVVDLGQSNGDSGLSDAMEVDSGAGGPMDAGQPMTLEARIIAVKQRFGLMNMTTRIELADVAEQVELYGGQVDFESALVAALNNFLTDGRDEESPLRLVVDAVHGNCGLADMTERVRCFMNDPRTIFTLYGSIGFAPENGERVEQNWIFVLQAESLSDHIQWAIVDRMGRTPTYNYGFN
ncbi:MAG: hypothetical protein VYA30_16520 [Myxococcota bacterium]|nr:hypothetical protein [Myxococcota bacterium]